MNRKITLIAAILIFTGAACVIAFRLGKESSAPPATEPAVTGQTNPAATEPRTASGLAPTEPNAGRRQREVRDPDLVDQYGETRTNLSRHVVSDVVSLLDDAVAMGDMMLNGESAGRFGRNDWALQNAIRSTGVELSDEQQSRARELFAEFQQRELGRSKEALDKLKKNPTPLMGLLLASDARSREEITETEYAAQQQVIADELDGVINPLDRNNFRPRDPMEDETFRNGFSELLEDGQKETFDNSIAEREAAAEENAGERKTDISHIPVMDLESLETAVGSARKMTSGFKQVMEGMSNLGPILEQQGQRREGGNEE